MPMSEKQYKEKQRFDIHLSRLGARVYPSMEDGFDRELEQLRRLDEKVRCNLDEFFNASLGSSLMKNRFPDVKPNEGTIVRLNKINSRGDGTYINANYIDARKKFNVPFFYIATQAPMKNTVLDFWRMVYEHDAAFIVMLCAVQENGKAKSEMYWPPWSETYDLGILTVTLVSESVRQDLIHRRLLLRSISGNQKEVSHMQYLAWPDQGVPQGSVSLMEMIYNIAKSPRSTQSPIVVHCSGGVGRTGVFIALHITLAQFQLGQENISIPRIVGFLKACRSGMVRRKDQYLFLYYAAQREMERMILSQQMGVNLLESRLPLTQVAPPPTMPIPARVHKQHITPILAPRHSPTSPHFIESHPVSIQGPNNRLTDNDAAAMENYLQHTVTLPSSERTPETSYPANLRPRVPSHKVVRTTSPSLMSSFTPTPRESKMHRGQDNASRSSIRQLLQSTSLVQMELARQLEANRIKRFSPSPVGNASSNPMAVSRDPVVGIQGAHRVE